MFEVDEEGNEWIGYTFGSDDEPDKVTDNFLGNVQYAEWLFRKLSGKRGRTTLEAQLNFLFALLPQGVERAVTDSRPTLVLEIVRTRNRFAHGLFEQARPATSRVLTLSIKVAALLSFAERASEGESEAVREMAQRGSPYLRKVLGETDVQGKGTTLKRPAIIMVEEPQR